MATSEQLDRQFRRELEAKQEGMTRLAERTRAAEDRSYASSTVYGTSLIKHGLGAIAKEIGERITSIDNGQAAAYAEAVVLIKETDPYVLAVITAKTLIDGLGKCRGSADPTYVSITTMIGTRVEQQLMLDSFETQNKDLFRNTADNIHAHKGYGYKVQRYRAAMRKNDIEWQLWTPTIRHKVGAWLVDRLAKATGWIGSKVTYKQGRKSSVLTYQPEFLRAQEALLAQAQSYCACLWPMLCEPNDWTDQHSGGYLTNDIRKLSRLVRVRDYRGSTILRNSKALTMLNTLQRVPYRVNPIVLGVANFCMEHRISVGKFRAEDPTPPPPKPDPWETAPEEDKLAYRKARTEIEDRNSFLAQNNYRTIECLFVANKYKDDPFWIPWSFDYRGRCYPIPTSLSPQGTDFEKSLFLFEEEGLVVQWWLAFQVATTYGLDKATMDDRLTWTYANHALISKIASDPKGMINEWSVAEEPWCFLAACLEYHSCVIVGDKKTSGLPIAVDATCSGLQHLSALTLDRTAAEMVNVVPTAKPSDGYLIVANKAKEKIPEHLHQYITRKVTKRTVMTTPYGVTRHSARDYIRQELKGVSLEKGELTEIVKAIYDFGVKEIFSGPVLCMNFIQGAVKEQIKSGKEVITWITPSGFPVIQNLRIIQTERIATKLLGTTLTANIAKQEPGPVDIDHHVSASAPNVIHSLDAALLHCVFANWEGPFTVIHDCVLGRSCDMDLIAKAVRNEFVSIYSQPVLRNWADQIGAVFDDSIMKNTLDINDVQASPYFFC